MFHNFVKPLLVLLSSILGQKGYCNLPILNYEKRFEFVKYFICAKMGQISYIIGLFANVTNCPRLRLSSSSVQI
jgi:hypothetical protein